MRERRIGSEGRATRPDPVDAALAALAASATLEPPDAGLEARLRARHASLPLPRGARRLRVAATFLAVALGGVALAAGGGRVLRALWIRVAVEGDVRTEVLPADEPGLRAFAYTASDGSRIEVRVSREPAPPGSAGSADDALAGARTEIAVDRRGPGRIEEERAAFGPGPSEAPRLPRAVLAGTRPIHRFAGADGVRLALTLLATADGTGARVLLDEEDSDAPEPVREVAVLPRPLGAIETLDLRELAGGGIRLTLSAPGWEHVLELGGAAPPAGPLRLRTPDGAVEVEVEVGE